MTNFGEFLFDFGTKALNLCDVLYRFLTKSIVIGDLSVSIWALFGGVGIVTLITWSLVKALLL